ncbi:methylisocitrate lyase [Flavobacteriaceae bacterium UJ101]|nr:methylisocitrate lyase [Flavobacteriaceae bacterium UJ101]
MIIHPKQPSEKRADFVKALQTGELLQFPGAYNALVAKLIEKLEFDGLYVSGGVMANTLGLADIGLTTQSEVVQMSSDIAKVSSLPTIMDIDTGFGEPMNVFRTIKEIEYRGLSGCHLEDQVNPKRCGHLDNKQIVETTEMVKKVRAAVDARTDANFQIIARTDARAKEGLESTIDRIKAYVDAGATIIFPEALKDEKEFEAVRKAIDVPLLANMTEFGKSKLLTKQQLKDLGFNIVIYPVTTQRLAMKNVEDGLTHIKEIGDQIDIVEKMQTRKRLYEVIDYEKYNEIDSSIFNFNI